MKSAFMGGNATDPLSLVAQPHADQHVVAPPLSVPAPQPAPPPPIEQQISPQPPGFVSDAPPELCSDISCDFQFDFDIDLESSADVSDKQAPVSAPIVVQGADGAIYQFRRVHIPKPMALISIEPTDSPRVWNCVFRNEEETRFCYVRSEVMLRRGYWFKLSRCKEGIMSHLNNGNSILLVKRVHFVAAGFPPSKSSKMELGTLQIPVRSLNSGTNTREQHVQLQITEMNRYQSFTTRKGRAGVMCSTLAVDCEGTTVRIVGFEDTVPMMNEFWPGDVFLISCFSLAPCAERERTPQAPADIKLTPASQISRHYNGILKPLPVSRIGPLHNLAEGTLHRIMGIVVCLKPMEHLKCTENRGRRMEEIKRILYLVDNSGMVLGIELRDRLATESITNLLSVREQVPRIIGKLS
ncbi:hypothetical protein Pelo_6899 [Pelomyxa schiedti]|nr:hypothetical protein Pelo_6899 [Pelomyxa schiedti]